MRKTIEAEINSDLIHLIEDYVSISVDSDLENLSLYHDLGIYGDDVDELLNEYINKFNVSISNFHSTDYFPNEGDEILKTVWNLITRKKKTYKRLTIGDLHKGISEGKLKL